MGETIYISQYNGWSWDFEKGISGRFSNFCIGAWYQRKKKCPTKGRIPTPLTAAEYTFVSKSYTFLKVAMNFFKACSKFSRTKIIWPAVWKCVFYSKLLKVSTTFKKLINNIRFNVLPVRIGWFFLCFFFHK